MRSTYSQIRFSASDLAIASSRTIQVVYAGFVCIASYRFLLGVWIEYIHVRILRTHGLRQICLRTYSTSLPVYLLSIAFSYGITESVL